ncbi:MAG: class I SAM-dependent methyltransferase [Nitrosopumilaceae archaeon]
MTQHWFIAHLIEKYSRGKSYGCDIGIGKDNWAQFKHCKTIGVDRQNKCKPDVVVDLENPLPFKNEIFDFIIAINSLNYVENGRQLIFEINRIMKKNATLVCVVDNEKSSSQPHVWEQRYLDRLLQVSGFRSILSKNIKDFFYAKWFNKTSVYAFAVVKKEKAIKKNFSITCSKCGRPLGKDWEYDDEKQPNHIQCPTSNFKKTWARSYSIETTHPDQ